MCANAIGIPLGSFINRLKFKKPDPTTSLSYELFVLLLIIPMFILSIIISIFKIKQKNDSKYNY